MFQCNTRLWRRGDARGRFGISLTFLFVLLAVAVPGAFAGLERVGPTSAGNGYPAWYQDATGLTLEFCSPQNQAELNGGWCLLLPGDTSFPESFPNTFADEHFYWAGESGIDFAGGGRARLILGLEAAFAVDQVVDGDQIVFGRIRIDIRDLPAAGTYTVYHPFGTWVFDVTDPDRLFHTEDIGITCAPGSFDCALDSNLGPFLLPSNTPGGAELPAITGPVPNKLYIADPGRVGPVTGSPIVFTGSSALLASGQRQNIFRVEGPGGFVIESTDFSLMGRLYTGPITGRVLINRASYSKSQGENKLDVFATASPTVQGRLPGNPPPAAVTPVLGFYQSACAQNPDGSLGLPAGAVVQMFANGSDYWGQSQPPLVPPAVCVEDFTARDATGQLIPAFFERAVTDEVYVTEALYDPADGGSLSVKAESSDKDTGIELSLPGYGNLTNGQITVAPLAAPPHKIRVLSTTGGLGEAQVITLAGQGGGGGPLVPVALNDAITVAEDSGSINIPVLNNDTYDGSPAVPAQTAVTIVNAPSLGSAAVNADGTVAFTPFANASGSDSLTYAITVGNQTSSVAFVSITITPVNDPPVAVADAAPGVLGQALVLSLLANDSDPDSTPSQNDLGAAVLEGAWPAGLGPNPFVNGVAAGGVVNITPAAAGSFSFTYRARDLSGAVSANAATVSITVIGSETITVANAEFRIVARRWRVSGTDSVRANQTLTISYANGTRANGSSVAGVVIGTATVDATGAWALDIRNVTGDLDPSLLSFPNNNRQIRITSPLGASIVTTFTVRF